MPKTDEQIVAEARTFTKARKARERNERKRAHNKKMLDAVRSGNKDELKKLIATNPLEGLSGLSKRQRTGRPMRDIMFGKSVSRTYVSEIILDEGGDFTPSTYFNGYHRGET
jgi:hypothetical protein